jgi:hypothetical protein
MMVNTNFVVEEMMPALTKSWESVRYHHLKMIGSLCLSAVFQSSKIIVSK